MIEVINEAREVQIRKARYCLFCYRDYPIGSKMFNEVNKCDGRIASVYWCPTCQTLVSKYYNALRDRDYDGGVAAYTIAGYADEFNTTPEGFLEMLDSGILEAKHGYIDYTAEKTKP